MEATDLTPAQITESWRTFGCDYASCQQTINHRCRTASGALAAVHANRRVKMAAYLSRQPEVDALNALVTSLRAANDQLTATLQTADEKADALAGQVASLTADVKDRDDSLTRCSEASKKLTADLAAARARIAELEADVPAPDPEPEPTSDVLPFGIGVNEKITAAPGVPTVYTLARLEQEAGVKFTYVHEYFTFPSSGVLASVVTWCETHLKAGRIPVPTIKLPSNDWAGAAAGKYDATIGATTDALEALAVKYGLPVLVITHHEPTGDGDRDTFLAMYRHLRPIIQRPGHVQYWMNLEGWAQILDTSEKVWNLENLKVDGIDGYLFDPYLAFWQLKNNSTKFTDMVKTYLKPLAEWCKTNGFQVGIGETGMTAVAQAKSGVPNDTWWTDMTAGAQALGYGPFIYWNNYNPNSGNDWRITPTKPANMLGQMVAAMKKYAPR